MKTLYISDLDGTLLNKYGNLSTFSRKGIVRLLKKGIYFSVATARSHVTSRQVLAGVDIKYPIVCMNGAYLYDLDKECVVSKQVIDKQSYSRLVDIVCEYDLFGAMYSIEGNNIRVYYQKPKSPEMVSYIEKRRKYGYNLIERDFHDLLDTDIVYFSFNSKKERVADAEKALKTIDGLNVEFYLDTYRNTWYLETAARESTKYHGVLALKKLLDVDRMVCFGDNSNDLKMFSACDEAYAVQNARSEVISAATGIIASNEDNGVVNYLLSLFD